MTGRRSRSKGAQGERETRDAFRVAMPGADIKRGLGQARSASEVADVECPAFWLENKRGKKPNVRAALQQAHDACKDPDRWPVAVIRDDRKPAFIAMGLEDFLELVAAWWSRGGRGRTTQPSSIGEQFVFPVKLKRGPIDPHESHEAHKEAYARLVAEHCPGSKE